MTYVSATHPASYDSLAHAIHRRNSIICHKRNVCAAGGEDDASCLSALLDYCIRRTVHGTVYLLLAFEQSIHYCIHLLWTRYAAPYRHFRKSGRHVRTEPRP